MNIKEKILEIKYLWALYQYGRAHMKYLKNINEVQSFGKEACFDGYPEIEIQCDHLKNLDSNCDREKCPLCHIYNNYVMAKKNFDAASKNMQLAQTAMLCQKIKE